MIIRDCASSFDACKHRGLKYLCQLSKLVTGTRSKHSCASKYNGAIRLLKHFGRTFNSLWVPAFAGRNPWGLYQHDPFSFEYIRWDFYGNGTWPLSQKGFHSTVNDVGDFPH